MRRPKRILFARPADAKNLNAQAKNTQNILRYWRSTEYRPSVIAFSDPDLGVSQNPNVDIVELLDGRLWRAHVFATYMRQFDAVFCPGVHHLVDWLALKTRSTVGRPLSVIATMEGLLSERDDDEHEQQFSTIAGHRVHGQNVPGPVRRRFSELLRMADHIIAISPFLERQASASYGPKASWLPLGVDLALFPRPKETGQSVRPRVVGAGHVSSRKRPDVFVRLAREFPDADFVWFGDGDLRASLIAEAGCCGLSNLSFPGALPPRELAGQFAASNILVHPSLAEGVPKVTQEAAAAGLAQIIFGFYEAPSVVDGVNGFVVWSDSQLEDRLRSLLQSPDMVERMGQAGRKMAESWSWEIVAPQWEDRIIRAVEASHVARPGLRPW